MIDIHISLAAQHYLINSVKASMISSTITLSAVEYLNTKPFIEGLKVYDFDQDFRIELDTPADCSRKLRTGLADIGIVPVADFPSLKGFRQLGGYGIGADGAVKSVLLVSNKPLEALSTIVLDYQSRTSNALARILVRDHYGLDVRFESGEGQSDLNLEAYSGAVLIGDRAIKHADRFTYRYDLAEAWKAHTGLPFLFAIWVGSPRVSTSLESELEKSFEEGMKRRAEVARQYQSSFQQIDVLQYFTEHIRYRITPEHREAMRLFLEKVSIAETINERI